jgi:hypothetical protein
MYAISVGVHRRTVAKEDEDAKVLVAGSTDEEGDAGEGDQSSGSVDMLVEDSDEVLEHHACIRSVRVSVQQRARIPVAISYTQWTRCNGWLGAGG